jgi:hypothetical protein
MAGWAGIALALRAPADDALHSRLPTYLHPLAGRSLVWHTLNSITAIRPTPQATLLVTPEPIDRAVLGELPVEPVTAGGQSWWHAVEPGVPAEFERLLIVDAAAAALATALARLSHGPLDRVLLGEGGEPLAVWIGRGLAEERWRATEVADAGGPGGSSGIAPLAALAEGLEPVAVAPAEGVLVRDRASLARAGMAIRDRLVANLLAGGVTFLLPETVLVDVDVRIGSDTVIYPGVILEGQTTIGTETVIGPGCRIIDSWIGSGVELKGWNYIAGANVRNRAVLEPYVRRGFD